MVRKLIDWFKGSGTGGIFSSPTRTILWTLRMVFLFLTIGIATSALFYLERTDLLYGVLAFAGIVAIGLVVIFTDIFTRNKQITTVSAVYFGLLLGFLLAT